MVSISKIGHISNQNILEMVGLSTDVKPIGHLDKTPIPNGSTFLEMDTSNVYIYDEENGKYYLL